MYDPPHLDKGIRNNLLNKFLEINIGLEKPNRQFAKWEVISKAYLFDKHSYNVKRSLDKLTDAHINPTGKKKMKVSLAAQVLNGTVAKYLDILSLLPGNILYMGNYIRTRHEMEWAHHRIQN